MAATPSPSLPPTRKPLTAEKAALLEMFKGSPVFVPPKNEHTSMARQEVVSSPTPGQPASKGSTMPPVASSADSQRRRGGPLTGSNPKQAGASGPRNRQNSAPAPAQNTGSLDEAQPVVANSTGPYAVNGQERQTRQPSTQSMMPKTNQGIQIPSFDPNKYGNPAAVRKVASRKENDAPSVGRDTTAPRNCAVSTSEVRPHSVSYEQHSEGRPRESLEISNEQEQKLFITETSLHSSPSPPTFELKTKVEPSPAPNEINIRKRDDHDALPSAREYFGSPLASNKFLQNSISKPSRQSTTSMVATEARHSETPEQKLRRVQAGAMQNIGFRLQKRDTTSTTSLTDLALARKRTNSPLIPLPQSQFTSVSDTLIMNNPNAAGETILTPVRPQSAAQEGRDGDSERQKVDERNVDSSLPNWSSTPPARPARNASGIHPAYQIPEWPKSPEEVVLPPPATDRRSRFATPAEIRPEKPHVEVDSNAWGSEIASDAAASQGDSYNPMRHGKLFRRNRPVIPEVSLQGWDGAIQPPPPDWHDRPMFNNNTPAFKDGFNNWTKATAELVVPKGRGDVYSEIEKIPRDKLEHLELIPDGLKLVPKSMTLNSQNVTQYGYDVDIRHTTKHCQPLREQDWADWGKVDPKDPLNARASEETTEILVQNWMVNKYPLLYQQLYNSRTLPSTVPTQAAQTKPHTPKTAPKSNPNRPTLNIYLRPAVRTDLTQLTSIYNWHVLNGPCCAEIEPIKQSDMKYRFDSTLSSKLPFIVAVLRKDTKSDNRDTIVGFACAQDFTCADYVERISAELEIYVHATYLHRGVGKCLLDKLLESTDRGYVAKRGYPWHCDPTLSHKYEAGGGRDLHLLIFVVRHWRYPRTDKFVEDKYEGKVREDDFGVWLKPWLVERWEFEVMGRFPGLGTKEGRYLTTTYLCKETKWQPVEGQIPEYSSALAGEAITEGS